MKTLYTELNIRFSVENTAFSAPNIVFERFFRSIPKHSHSSNSYEIHYIPYGKGTLIMDGVTYEITPNTLFITGPHVEHEQVPNRQDPMSEYCIYLKIEKSPKSTSEDITAHSAGAVFERTKSWFGKDTQDLHPVMQMIFHELEHEYSGYMTQVTTLLQQCIIKIIRNYEQRKGSEKHFGPSNLSDSKYIIAEEYFLYDYRTLSLGELAGKLSLSNRQTERFLRECYGKTFTQKKAESRMSVAVLLLADQSRSITDIANELGYSSLEHFSTAFRQFYGITALNYRKTHTVTIHSPMGCE